MEYKWTINKVQVAEDNLIVKVDLTVTGTDNDLTTSAAYTRTLIRGDSFIPYEQLTEQQVLDWCFAPEIIDIKDKEGNIVDTVTSYLKEDGEAQVTGQIARKLAQKALEPALPWSV